MSLFLSNQINSTLWYRTWIRRHWKEAGVDVQTCLLQDIVQCDRFPVYIKHVLLVRVGHFQTVHAWVEVQQRRRGGLVTEQNQNKYRMSFRRLK